MQKKYYILSLCCILVLYAMQATAQVYNAGSVYIPSGGNAAAWGDLVNTDSGKIINAGNLYANYNIANAGTTGYDGGKLLLTGTASQVLSGTAIFYTTDLTINNSSGVILKKRYSVSGQVGFSTGIIAAPVIAEPFEFNPGGNGSSVIAASGASDASHVYGYTFQLGTGSFVYPVGDSSKYQPVAANLSTNSNGMLCHYIPADAGTGPYLSTGLSNVPLWHYNHLEYWDLAPAGTATGTVTIYYDGYRNTGIGTDYNTALMVAHKVSSGWNNEGGVVSGTQASGTVTTIGDISSWSPFTLGSISNISALPLELNDFTAKEYNCTAVLSWNTGVETNIAAFDVQYSTDGVQFETVGSVRAQGGGGHYTYTCNPHPGRAFFRLSIKEYDGSYSYSSVLILNMTCSGHSVTVFPNPVTIGTPLYVTLTGYDGPVTGALYDIAGRLVSYADLVNGGNVINMENMAVGAYQLCIISRNNAREVYKIIVTH